MHNLRRHSSSFPVFLTVFSHFFAVLMTLNKYILPTLNVLKRLLEDLKRVFTFAVRWKGPQSKIQKLKEPVRLGVIGAKDSSSKCLLAIYFKGAQGAVG